MIVALKGKIKKKEPPVLWIETSSGLTYQVLMPIPCFAKLTENEVFIYTHLIVREDSQSLFGFSNQQNCNLFKLLIKINGVGAKTALAILSSFTMSEFQALAINKDIKTLTKVPGIGAKTAQRMMVDIAGFITQLNLKSDLTQRNQSTNLYQAKQALIALGFREIEVDKLTKDLDNSLNVSSLVKLALGRK